jgi:hypothetical protein
MPRRSAIALVRWAREQVPLYRDLYRDVPPVETWRDFRRLPVLTAARLSATPLAEQVDTPDDTFRTFTPYQLRAHLTPAAIPCDRDDTDAAFYETHDAFRWLGVRRGARVVVLTAPEQRYFAAELAERLGYFGVQAHLLVQLDNATLVRQVAALAPDHIVGVATAGTPPVHPSITVRAPASAVADLYIVPEAGIVAVRPRGEKGYILLRRHALVEASHEGRLLLTTLRRYHRPLIRYELPDRGRLSRGRLLLDEVAL